MEAAPFGSSERSESPGAAVRTAGIVLNYCTPDLALQAARSLAEDLDPAQDRVIIVDNASPDDSRERITAGLREMTSPHVSLVVSDRNGGFAYGNNVGIRSVVANEYLLLNSDTVVRPGAMTVLREGLRSAPEIGIVSPRLQFENADPQVSCFRQHSPVSEFVAAAQTGKLTKLLRRWEVPLGVQQEPVDVEWTSFACVLVSREVFERVGYLDEDFFMYYEDANFCSRARAGGFRVVHFPEAQVVHLRGKSSPVKEATRLMKARPRYYYESRNLYYRRALGPPGPLLANLMWTSGRAIALIREAMGQKRHSVKDEWIDNWRGTFSQGKKGS